MHYSLEELYRIVGKDDLVAGVTFKSNSEAFKLYGDHITVVFIYTQNERETFDHLIKDEYNEHHGKQLAKYLGMDLSKEKVDLLLKEGINTKDIFEVIYFGSRKTNTFHSLEKRHLVKLEIPFVALPKGKDLNWMYGFYKDQVKRCIGLSPKERNFYLAGKLYFEASNLDDLEKSEIYSDQNKINESIEYEYLQMKLMRNEISNEESVQLKELNTQYENNCKEILNNYLRQSGSSLKKLVSLNIEKAVDLLYSTINFHERRINVSSKYPVYVDIDSYLHIFMRHAEEFKVNSHFEHKDNFQWNIDDIFLVMGHVVNEIDSEYQEFRESNPDTRFSRFGNKNIYFQGDYYTIHIEINGRISTFYKNKKQHESKMKSN